MVILENIAVASLMMGVVFTVLFGLYLFISSFSALTKNVGTVAEHN